MSKLTAHDIRIDVLTSITTWDRFYAIGFLTVWHQIARNSCPQKAPLEQLEQTIPSDAGGSSQAIIQALARAGYIDKVRGQDLWRVVDNEHCEELSKKRSQAGKKGAAARHGKARKKRKTAERRQAQAQESQPFALVPVQPHAIAKRKEPESAPYWRAYCDAYMRRYHVMPLRNQKVNGQFVQLMTRIPKESMVGFLNFYLEHIDYEGCKHTIGAALAKAEVLHTEFLEGRATTRRELAQKQISDGFAAQMARIERGEID